MSSDNTGNGKTSVPGTRRKPVPIAGLLAPMSILQEIKSYQLQLPALPTCCNGRRTGHARSLYGR